ncbi:MAG: Protein-L-isoaspartate O-methyltransferase, partial [Pseudomonadota bacterium]
MNQDQARFNMIEQQIRPWDVLDGQVLSLLSVVKREDFVPLAHKALAFVDMEVPLQANGSESQVMLAPRVEARFLQDAALQATDKVLEIGTGSGYMAALAAHQAASVLSFEIDSALAQQARTNLQAAGVTNVEVRNANGCQGAA